MKRELTAELVIPSYNRIDTLRTTLGQIRTIYPELNICIGIQGDVPAEFENEVKRDQRLRVLRFSTPGTTPTLNACILSSAADIVLISDDDSVPHFGWLEAHLHAFRKNQDLAYTAGRELRSSKEKSAFSHWVRIPVETFFGLFLGQNKKLNGRIVGWINALGLIFGNLDQPGTCIINAPRGCNMAVRRSVFADAGGFNDKFRGNAYLFEAEFGIRMAKAGRYGQYCGDAIVVHHEVSSGGSRAGRSKWFNDYLFNHRFIISLLGPQAWLGSLPRLIKKKFFS